MGKEEKPKRRQFNGDIHSHDPREKKHLKAYLNGDKFFTYGKLPSGEPRRFQVMESWK